jgi:hypothetical protein
MAKFLKLPGDRLSKLAELQRREEWKRHLAGPPTPMFREIRELIVRKCIPGKTKQVQAIFEKQPFGELERLVTQKLFDVVKKVVKEELNSETGSTWWLDLLAEATNKCGLPSLTSWTLMFSACRLKIAFPSWIH